MKKLIALSFIVFLLNLETRSQDTFSIVAVDPETGEVGSAGASCVDLSSFPGFVDHFLGELFPGVGAINTQAWYNQTNQLNARNRMNNGDTPNEIIDWLIANDVSGQPELRQYGVVALVDDSLESAGHTGASTDDYKNHITGSNYAIQGNILLGQEILDSMEARFLNAEGDLACKLMAALQGANVIGADTRCGINGTSSLFAFVKVAQPNDPFGSPSFVQSVRTSEGTGIEPIDSLQSLFDSNHDCLALGTSKSQFEGNPFTIYPNPATDAVTIENRLSKACAVQVYDITGKVVYKSELNTSLKIETKELQTGIYFIRISDSELSFVVKLIKL